MLMCLYTDKCIYIQGKFQMIETVEVRLLRSIDESLRRISFELGASKVAEKAVEQTSIRPKKIGSLHVVSRIDRIINAIMLWNDDQEDSSTRIAIRHQIINIFAKEIGGVHQRVFQDRLADRLAEISDHHYRYGLVHGHNSRLQNRTHILQLIARDYLKIETWQSVEF
jgi:hypothetical protein